jgi:hypothetical protein
MNTTITASATLEKIKEGINKLKKMPQVREIPDFPIGKVGRQGDLYFQRINPEEAKKGGLRKSLQLVPGNTIGSSHCVVESPHVSTYESLESPVSRNFDGDQKIVRFPGPVIVALQVFSISHKKHGWMAKLPAGVYQTFQQCDYTRQRAAKD